MSEIDDLRAAWSSAEAVAFTGAGYRPDIEDVWTLELTGDGDWIGAVYLPKNTRGGSVNQAYPGPGVVHRPTEELLARLEGYEPGTEPPPKTVGGLLMHLIPPPDTFRYQRITVRTAEDIPAAVDRSLELAREHMLPWQRRYTDPAVLREYLAGKPYLKHLRYGNLRRLVVFEHLRGDDAGARAALDAYRAEYPGSRAPEVQARHEAFVAAAVALLAR
ncbi:hypothetical protein OG417_20265 [Actinoallomurus sp. NBC_01490]|uniref:hypothetical protein n=1 Tax=Actinoallomurus sp. NBC_01490 TaxID=2903557 RepID=UPI002E36A4FF|nr:hypothetical protein [Actinoallomurus sp. NBC_01490]